MPDAATATEAPPTGQQANPADKKGLAGLVARISRPKLRVQESVEEENGQNGEEAEGTTPNPEVTPPEFALPPETKKRVMQRHQWVDGVDDATDGVYDKFLTELRKWQQDGVAVAPAERFRKASLITGVETAQGAYFDISAEVDKALFDRLEEINEIVAKALKDDLNDPNITRAHEFLKRIYPQLVARDRAISERREMKSAEGLPKKEKKPYFEASDQDRIFHSEEELITALGVLDVHEEFIEAALAQSITNSGGIILSKLPDKGTVEETLRAQIPSLPDKVRQSIADEINAVFKEGDPDKITAWFRRSGWVVGGAVGVGAGFTASVLATLNPDIAAAVSQNILHLLVAGGTLGGGAIGGAVGGRVGTAMGRLVTSMLGENGVKFVTGQDGKSIKIEFTTTPTEGRVLTTYIDRFAGILTRSPGELDKYFFGDDAHPGIEKIKEHVFYRAGLPLLPLLTTNAVDPLDKRAFLRHDLGVADPEMNSVSLGMGSIKLYAARQRHLRELLRTEHPDHPSLISLSPEERLRYKLLAMDKALTEECATIAQDLEADLNKQEGEKHTTAIETLEALAQEEEKGTKKTKKEAEEELDVKKQKAGDAEFTYEQLKLRHKDLYGEGTEQNKGLNQEIEEQKKKKQIAESTSRRLQNQHANTGTSSAPRKSEIQKLQEQAGILETEVSTLESEIAPLKRQIADIDNTIPVLVEELNKIKVGYTDSKSGKVYSIEDEVNTRRVEIGRELATLQSTRPSLETRLHEKESLHEAKEKRRSQKEKDWKGYQSEINEQQVIIDQAEIDLKRLEKLRADIWVRFGWSATDPELNRDDINKKIEEAKRAADKLRGEANVLEQQLPTIETASGIVTEENKRRAKKDRLVAVAIASAESAVTIEVRAVKGRFGESIPEIRRSPPRSQDEWARTVFGVEAYGLYREECLALLSKAELAQAAIDYLRLDVPPDPRFQSLRDNLVRIQTFEAESKGFEQVLIQKKRASTPVQTEIDKAQADLDAKNIELNSATGLQSGQLEGFFDELVLQRLRVDGMETSSFARFVIDRLKNNALARDVERKPLFDHEAAFARGVREVGHSQKTEYGTVTVSGPEMIGGRTDNYGTVSVRTNDGTFVEITVMQPESTMPAPNKIRVRTSRRLDHDFWTRLPVHINPGELPQNIIAVVYDSATSTKKPEDQLDMTSIIQDVTLVNNIDTLLGTNFVNWQNNLGNLEEFTEGSLSELAINLPPGDLNRYFKSFNQVPYNTLGSAYELITIELIPDKGLVAIDGRGNTVNLQEFIRDYELVFRRTQEIVPPARELTAFETNELQDAIYNMRRIVGEELLRTFAR